MNTFGDHCPEWLWRRVQHQRQRCQCPQNNMYHRYGGRGIEFRFSSTYEGACWIVENLGLPDDLKMTLDRIDNDGHYEPGNLRWATPSQQMSNRGKFIQPNSRYRRFLKAYPYVTYGKDYLGLLFRKGLTAEQIAERWRKRYGT